MANKKGSTFTNDTNIFRGPSKRFIVVIMIITASILFYGYTPSADEESPLTSVTIIDGENVFEVETKGQTVLDAFATAGVVLAEGDTASKDVAENVTDGDIIVVNRMKKISLVTGGATYDIQTNAATVGEALLSDGFQVGKYDEVTPDVNAPVVDGMTVEVVRVYVELYEVEDDISFSSKTVENHQKFSTHKQVVQTGKNGKVLRTFKKISKTGTFVTATLIGETVIEKPVEEIIEVGTKKPIASGEILPAEGLLLTPGKTTDGVPYHALPTMAQKNSATNIEGNIAVTASGTFAFSKRIVCKATAYEGSAASNGKWAGMTATGRKPVYGVIAVDPSVIPLNSKLYIESADGGKSWIYGFAVAGDTGGAIKGNKIDLCYNTLDQCYQFGRRDAIVYILD